MSRHKQHKKHKKRKPSRRERRAGVDRQAKRPDAPKTGGGAAPEPSAQTPAPAQTPTPAPEAPAPEADTPEAPAPEEPAPTVTATFRPAGKAQATVALEQRYIGRDLRRLLIQLGAFALVIAGLAVLDAQTDAVGRLGSSLFALWE